MKLLKFLSFCLFFLSSCVSVDACRDKALEEAEKTFYLAGSLTTSIVKRSRNSAVKVFSFSESGESIAGSGAYMRHRGKHFILTAAHVVTGRDTALVVASGEKVIAEVVYCDDIADIAILKVEGLFTKRPLVWRTGKPRISGEAFYTGNPNGYEDLSIKGYVAGTYGGYIVLHSYAWGGASGSVVLDEYGRVLGVLVAVDMASGFLGMPSIVEDIVLITPIDNLDIEDLMNALH